MGRQAGSGGSRGLARPTAGLSGPAWRKGASCQSPHLWSAACTSVVHGRLMFEGKLVAAVIAAKLGLELDYEWTGEEG